MKKDLVTYKQALALHKLGFCYPCRWWYDKNGDLLNMSLASELYDIEYDGIPAPTLTQILKWFLKVKNIYINAIFDNISTHKWIACWDSITNDNFSGCVNNRYFGDPEEALRAGIDECLKLLEAKK